MSTFDEVKNGLEDTIVGPLNALWAKIATINGYHNQCLKQCEDAINALVNGTDGQPAFQGPSGQALSNSVANYLSTARAVSGTDANDPLGNSLDGYMLKPVNIGEDIAGKLWVSLESINGPIQVASTSLSIPQGLSTPATVGTSSSAMDAAEAGVVALDTGALAQGGLDIPWDIVAGLATVVVGGILIFQAVTANPDQPKIDLANAYATEAKQLYDQQTTTYKNTEPLKPLPDSPKGPGGDFTKFLILIGIGVTAGGAVVFLNQLPVDPKKQISQLTPEELDKLKTYLMDVYGCSSAQIDKILQQVKDKNPTAGQVENLLKLLRLQWEMQAFQQDIKNAHYPHGDSFFNDKVGKLLDTIKKAIEQGTWDDSTKWSSYQIDSMQDNLNSAIYQYQVAQTLNARDIESTPPSIGADVTSSDNVLYEVKNSAVQQNDSNYWKLVEQLKVYIDEQPPNTRGVGVAVNPGSDRNLGAELLASLKAKYGNDPNIKWLKNIDVKFIPYNPPNPPSNRWCRM